MTILIIHHLPRKRRKKGGLSGHARIEEMPPSRCLIQTTQVQPEVDGNGVECNISERICVDLHLSGLFDMNLSPLASPKYRDICLATLLQFRNTSLPLQNNLANNNISAHAKILKTSVDNPATEQLDKDVTQTMLSTKKTCAHTSHLPISPKLTKPPRPGTGSSSRYSHSYAPSPPIMTCPVRYSSIKPNYQHLSYFLPT
jgi:hypothetical protein